METKAKILIGLLIFLPAFLYFIVSINGDKGIPVNQIVEVYDDDLILVKQSLSNRLSRVMSRIATANNQNILPREEAALQLVRNQ